MANFSITISNSMRVFGGSPATKWGQVAPYTMTWGATKWGQGTFSTIFSYDKLLTNSLSPTTIMKFDAQKLLTNTIAVLGNPSSEVLSNGPWRIVFVSDTVNVEDRDVATWTSTAAGVTTFTCLPAGSTTWS